MWWLIVGLVLTLIIVEGYDAVLDRVNKEVVSKYDVPWTERLRIIKRNTLWTWVAMMVSLTLMWVFIANNAA